MPITPMTLEQRFTLYINENNIIINNEDEYNEIYNNWYATTPEGQEENNNDDDENINDIYEQLNEIINNNIDRIIENNITSEEPNLMYFSDTDNEEVAVVVLRRPRTIYKYENDSDSE